MKTYRMRYTPLGAFGAFAFVTPPVAANLLLEAQLQNLFAEASVGRPYQFSTFPFTMLALVSMMGLCMMLIGRETFEVDDEDR